MAKEEVKPKKEAKKNRGKYDEKLAVKGSFMDIIKSAVKDADNKSAKKKS